MTAITIPQFEEVTSKQFQSEFGRIVDIVKGKTLWRLPNMADRQWCFFLTIKRLKLGDY